MTTDKTRSDGGSVFLSLGFRPFFLFGAFYAFIAISCWILYLAGYLQFPDVITDGEYFDPMGWHVHEMIFGYVAAIMGGFLLTAVPNWTGRLPIRGLPLLALACLWLLGRITVALLHLGALSPVWAAGLDLLYLTVLTLAILREIVAGKNWRNLPVVGILAVFDIANLISYLPLQLPDDPLFGDPLLGDHIALAAIAMAITLIGGRIIPAFTRNWLVKNGDQLLPAPHGVIDKLAILMTVISFATWAIRPEAPVTGGLLLIAGIFQLIRFSRWRAGRTWGEPMVLILHVGYGWLVLSFFTLAAAIFAPMAMKPASALHALTAGSIGVMTVAVMSRAILGHTGRALMADRGTVIIYGLINLGALLRVTSAWMPFDYFTTVAVAGMIWGLGFLIFAFKYGRYLIRPRLAA